MTSLAINVPVVYMARDVMILMWGKNTRASFLSNLSADLKVEIKNGKLCLKLMYYVVSISC